MDGGPQKVSKVDGTLDCHHLGQTEHHTRNQLTLHADRGSSMKSKEARI
jgi:hypothetical protein